MPTKTAVMKKKSDHKGTVRFDSADPTAPVSNVYVSREHMPGIGAAQEIRVTIEVPEPGK